MANVPQTKYPNRSFRPWPQTQQLFAFAEDQKFNVSELLNEIVVKHLKRHIEHKVNAQTRALQQLAPTRNTKPQLTKSRR